MTEEELKQTNDVTVDGAQAAPAFDVTKLDKKSLEILEESEDD